MLTITIKLYGSLPWRVPGYDPEKGLTLELAQGALVTDLATQLGIAAEEEMVIAMAGRVARPDDPIEDGATLRIFPVAHGG
ncbi:MAG: MoaD/ThiS family protein [Desulfatitalea sp.]|nr:MoaD/ThiS family protein [Desulfatitalea sp.]MBI5895997.1 MoaD/ThiS family protein [Desulfobacterales bacterium]